MVALNSSNRKPIRRTGSDAPVVRATNGGRYYHRNQQHSVNALTDSSGGIVERYAYDAYGGLSVFDGSGTARTATAEGNRYTYTGRGWDSELSLYHYRARMYDPMCGRFCSRDPIGYEADDSLYRFVGNRPLIMVDFDGLQAVQVLDEGTGNESGCTAGENACITDIKNRVKQLVQQRVAAGGSCFVPHRPSERELECRKNVDQCLLNTIDKISFECRTDTPCNKDAYRAVERRSYVKGKDEVRKKKDCKPRQKDYTVFPDPVLSESKIILCVSSPGSSGAWPRRSTDIVVWCRNAGLRRDLARTIAHEIMRNCVGDHMNTPGDCPARTSGCRYPWQ
ncbi:RHS repeat domain-containing protein [Rhodopirellula sp. MGV]|uniref:RHS repeat domain-containing protein n=1 Tax=Rhodopirellula sp. MGV TaxID=2023130 RepID=UPI000B963685|nr:RHS repeat-associated core domain-containing protein [Rhodopirellula sp. MGV]OYP33816.1 hypothetical protein CGZ80_17885 [Rhodopirellula sp. MGV]OYP38875.1 hypothetical protein CGZ80_01255 [Rhodopirellula sp. MGV]PNY37522.1 RHS repeat-associated core domain-containing protein [Rhodopirellula baltica]